VAHPGRWIALAVMTLGAFMVLVDTTIVNVAIPSIRSSLAATYADTQWVVAGYQLAYAIMLVTGGRLGDILGRRRLFMIGVVGFTATSVLGGAAQSPGMLIGSRIAQGLTGALMFPQGLSMIQAIFPEQERARAFGVFGAAAGLAIVLGPLLGGLIVGDQVGGESWRFVFLVNAPIGVVALLAAARFVPETRAPGAHGVDLGGVALVSVGLFGVTFPLLEGRDADWAPWIWLCIAGGVAVLLGFVTYERRRSGQGLPTLVQLGMFRERAFSIGSVLAFVLFVGIPSWLFTFNLMLQAGLGYTALHAGLTTLAFSGGVFVGAIMGVRLESRLGDRGVLALGTLFVDRHPRGSRRLGDQHRPRPSAARHGPRLRQRRTPPARRDPEPSGLGRRRCRLRVAHHRTAGRRSAGGRRRGRRALQPAGVDGGSHRA
jgi:EmrB/QacA subfamily drug resistance transporter